MGGSFVFGVPLFGLVSKETFKGNLKENRIHFRGYTDAQLGLSFLGIPLLAGFKGTPQKSATKLLF